jgi:hypothetical protein
MQALDVLHSFIMGAANTVEIHENGANRVVIKAREGFEGSYREREVVVERGLEAALVKWAKKNPRLGEEEITAAAIRDQDGKVWTLPQPARHCDVLKHIYEQTGKPTLGLHGDHQGFVTDTGRYVTRREGEIVARAKCQIKRGRIIGGELTSEDLW